MVDKYASESKLSPLLKKILTLLAELNQSRQGHVFYNHIKQTLEDWESTQEKIISTYAGLVNLLLDVLAAQLPPDSIALTHLKLVQTCLTPPLSEAELNLLKSSVEQATALLKHSTHIDAEKLDTTLIPILKQVLGEDPPVTENLLDESSVQANQIDEHRIESDPADQYRDANNQEAEQSAAHSDSPWEHTHDLIDGHTEHDDLDELNDPEHARATNAFEHVTDIGEDPVAHEKLVESQSLFERAKFATSNDNTNDTRPLKAPKAVLKMLRFPEEFKPAEIQKNGTDNTADKILPESTSETEDLLGAPYPSYDDVTLSDDNDTELNAVKPVDEHGDMEADSPAPNQSGEYEMERLHRDFVRQMRAIVAENAEFGVHLGLEIDALDDATKIQHVEDRRKAILASMKKLSESHTELAKKFDSAQSYLSIIESDKRKLSDELDRARMLSMTDELTSLPNRRAFIKRMDDEVSRVKRYGFPLSLVLIDIDHFKQVNDKYGHAAGDAVLRVYAEKILSIFRNHDMIARYGGEEFAVLLPNTDLDGVLRALDKVKGAVPNIQCTFKGVTIPAPTFSAGVTEYRAPETPTRFVERADHALYRAKRMGRNRIETEHKDHEHGVVDHNS